MLQDSVHLWVFVPESVPPREHAICVASVNTVVAAFAIRTDSSVVPVVFFKAGHSGGTATAVVDVPRCLRPLKPLQVAVTDGPGLFEPFQAAVVVAAAAAANLCRAEVVHHTAAGSDHVVINSAAIPTAATTAGIHGRVLIAAEPASHETVSNGVLVFYITHTHTADAAAINQHMVTLPARVAATTTAAAVIAAVNPSAFGER